MTGRPQSLEGGGGGGVQPWAHNSSNPHILTHTYTSQSDSPALSDRDTISTPESLLQLPSARRGLTVVYLFGDHRRDGMAYMTLSLDHTHSHPCLCALPAAAAVAAARCRRVCPLRCVRCLLRALVSWWA